MACPSPPRRPPGSLRLVSKTARGKTYTRWQWRTHRRTDTGWATFDVELGQDLAGLRTRTLIALGELNAPLILERWARWCFRSWDFLPAFTGRPEAARGHQRAAWWLELPRQAGESVRLRFRSLDGRHDFRRVRPAISKTEVTATAIWEALIDDPILELARLQWVEHQAQRAIDNYDQTLINLRRERRRGEISKHDFEADERMAYLRLDEWEAVQSNARARWDELLGESVAAMPRTHREALRRRIIATAERHYNKPKQQDRWRSDHWDGNTLTW